MFIVSISLDADNWLVVGSTGDGQEKMALNTVYQTALFLSIGWVILPFKKDAQVSCVNLLKNL